MIESDESSDYSFISKYLREDSKDNEIEMNDFKQRFKSKDSGTIEVFGSVGEGESFSQGGGGGFNKRFNNSNNNFQGNDNYDDNDGDNDDMDEKDENNGKSKPGSAKKEFLKQIKDDSLSLDTCERVGRDWKR